MIDEYRAKKYCKDDISLIENYEQAINDKNQSWHCHHRRESVYTREGLIEIGEYYDRPAIELIFLTKSEHIRIHMRGKHSSEDTKKKMSEAHIGKSFSEDTKKKMSEAHIGKHHTKDTREKISNTRKERIRSGKIKIVKRKLTERQRQTISEKAKSRLQDKTKHPMFGKKQSEESKKKISESHKGRTPWNKGMKKTRGN